MISDIIAVVVAVSLLLCQMVYFGSPVTAFTASTSSSSSSSSPLHAAARTHAHTIIASSTTCQQQRPQHQHQHRSFPFQLFESNDPNDNDAQDDGAKQQHQQHEEAMLKALKAMTSFSNKYIENTQTYYCSDLSIPAVVIKGLAEHKVKLGAPLCPCRFYEDKEMEAKDGYWNW